MCLEMSLEGVQSSHETNGEWQLFHTRAAATPNAQSESCTTTQLVSG